VTGRQAVGGRGPLGTAAVIKTCTPEGPVKTCKVLDMWAGCWWMEGWVSGLARKALGAVMMMMMMIELGKSRQ